MQIIVRKNTLGDLANDLASIARRAPADMAAVVRDNAREGNRLAKGFARASAGPHGKKYFKRISAERLTPLSWEYGPTGDPKTEFVGVGFRHGVNLDLPKSADVIGPKFGDDVANLPDKWFW